MKRIISIFLVALLVVSISGCAKQETTEVAEKATTEKATETEATATEEAVASTEPITFGHLSVYTGPFGHYGVLFDASNEFTMQYINENPPLGRPIEIINRDAGSGTAPVVRQFVEQDNIDILYNVEGEYDSYRDFLLEEIAENNGPLLPSIHAGSISSTRGGNADEPIFRGQPMDNDQALTAALHMSDMGGTKIVVMAVLREEMQLQQEMAAKACEYLGMEVLDGDIDLVPESPSFAAEAAKVAAMNPDGIIIFGAGEDAGTLVKNLSEAGVSAMIIGETNFTAEEFLATATLEAVQQQVFVKCATYGRADNAASDFYDKEWNDPKNADYFAAIDGDPKSTYIMSAYDLINSTALAIELAGSTEADAWVDAMYAVTMAPGKKVYTYAEGIEALRAGEEIDYEGVTGSFDYSATGVVSGIYQIQDWSTGELLNDVVIDGPRLLELSTALDNM